MSIITSAAAAWAAVMAFIKAGVSCSVLQTVAASTLALWATYSQQSIRQNTAIAVADIAKFAKGDRSDNFLAKAISRLLYVFSTQDKEAKAQAKEAKSQAKAEKAKQKRLKKNKPGKSKPTEDDLLITSPIEDYHPTN